MWKVLVVDDDRSFGEGPEIFERLKDREIKSRYVKDALLFIEDHLGDQNLSVGMIAHDLGLSEGHLSHVFKRETGYTINTYITRRRIYYAMGLLKDCRVKVYEVAEKSGYRDIAYFSAVFKKIVGMNPSEFQAR